MKRLAHNSEERPLFRELVEQIFSQLPAALFTLLLLSVLQILILWPLFPRRILLAWLAVIWVITLARFVLHYAYGKYSDRHIRLNRWLALYSTGTVLTGITWGLTPIFFFSDTSPQTNVFIAFVIGGLVAGAASSLAALKGTMRFFTALLCMPLITIFIATRDRLHVVMGIMMLIYAGAYLVMSSNMGRMIISSLRLRHGNLREIEERKLAETELRLIKDELESMVDLRTGELKTANEHLSKEVEERRQAEARLKISEERYRNLVESSCDWIWEVDRQGIYIYSSPSVESMLGYTPEEVLGRTFYELMVPDEAERTKAIFESNLANGQSFVSLVNRCLHKNGSVVAVETNGEPVFDDAGALSGFRGIDRDISQRVRHEEESRKVEHLESLGLLAGGIAHDFNNLLTAVFGNIELARLDVGPNSSAARSLDESAAAMEQARKLTGQLLTFSKGGNPVLETTSISDLILDTCNFVLSGSAIKCEFDLPDDLWKVVADQGQIWQVMNNILTNAREAMPEGGGVRVTAENVVIADGSLPGLSGGEYIRITVVDQGVGISKADEHRVFDPYFSTKARGQEKGTGIGLAVCHSVIEKHKGHIKLDSIPGKGTTVTFLLPAPGGDTDVGAAAAFVGGVSASGGLRVLLLEDDESVILTTTRMLEHLGHSVEVTRNGAEAIEVYSRVRNGGAPFDFVLLDLTIRGGMGGRETVEKLRTFDSRVTAVVTSGYADDPVMANCREYGFTAALIKPYNIKTLRDLIADLA